VTGRSVRAAGRPEIRGERKVGLVGGIGEILIKAAEKESGRRFVGSRVARK